VKRIGLLLSIKPLQQTIQQLHVLSKNKIPI
jgi:hypothetical protein